MSKMRISFYKCGYNDLHLPTMSKSNSGLNLNINSDLGRYNHGSSGVIMTKFTIHFFDRRMKLTASTINYNSKFKNRHLYVFLVGLIRQNKAKKEKFPYFIA